MAFQTSRDRSTDVGPFGDYVRKGHVYRLEDGRVGIVRYIGKLVAVAKGEWIGLELSQGKGRNNGTVKGTSYFSCPAGQGVFVQINRIQSKERARRSRTMTDISSYVRKAGPREIGRNDRFDEYKGDEPSSPVEWLKMMEIEKPWEGGSWLKERTGTYRSGASRGRSRTVRKKGPREIGRDDRFEAYREPERPRHSMDLAKDWLERVSTDKPWSGGDDFLKEKNLEARTTRRNSGNSTMRSRDIGLKKEGPREIGRNDDFRPYFE